MEDLIIEVGGVVGSGSVQGALSIRLLLLVLVGVVKAG